MKRMIFILLAVLFGGTLTAQNQFTIGDLTYEVLNGGNSVEVHDCDISATSVDIPSTVTNNGTTYSVTSIVLRAFSHCNILTSITIPNSVTYIGFSAFYGCSSLTTINVDSDNNNYSSIDGILYNYAQDTLIQCPRTKSSVTIPNSVTSILGRAFYGCRNLTSVTIPNSVTYIGYLAFYGCSNLTSITIPNSVAYIRDGAFSNCSSLTAINVDSDNTHYSSIDGILYNHAQDTLIQCPGAKSSVTIPNKENDISQLTVTN